MTAKTIISRFCIPHYFIAVFLILSSACTGLTGAVEMTVQSGGTSGSSPDGNNATEETSEGSEETLPDDGESDIQAVLPMPSNDGVIISAPDSGSFAYLQANNLDPSYSLLVTNDSAVARYEVYSKTWYARAMNAVLPSAHATDETPTDPCTAANTICLDIEADGTIEGGQIPSSMYGDSFTVKYVDRTTYATSDEGITEETKPVNYVANSPASEDALICDTAENKCYSLSEGGALNVLEFNEDTQMLEVTSGSAEDGFTDLSVLAQQALADVEEMEFSTERGYFVFRDSDGLLAQRLNGSVFDELDGDGDGLIDGIGGNVADRSDAVCGTASGCRPTKVKVRGDRAYYSTLYDENRDTAYVHELFSNAVNSIKIIDEAVDVDGHQIALSSTLAFDANAAGDGEAVSFALAVFDGITVDTEARGYFISGNNDMSSDIKVESFSTDENEEIKDLIIYSSFTETTESENVDGKALIMTSAGVKFVTYDLLDTSGDGGDGASITVSSNLSFANHTALVAALSSDASYLYVLNDDNSVTVVDTASKAVAANETITLNGEAVALDADGTFTLADILGFNADFALSEIKLIQVGGGGTDRLILGSNHMKGLISLAL